MEENPYAHHLEGREAIDIISTTAARMRELFAMYTLEEIDRSPGEKKWSLRELMAHLADCEIAWAWRIRQTLATDNPALQPFDQDRWGDPMRRMTSAAHRRCMRRCGGGRCGCWER